MTYGDDFIRTVKTSGGSRVFVNNIRLHHWMPGVILAGLGLLSLIFDDNEESRYKHLVSCLVGALLILDDLSDFVSFLQTMSNSESQYRKTTHLFEREVMKNASAG